MRLLVQTTWVTPGATTTDTLPAAKSTELETIAVGGVEVMWST
ncbi:MAG: hypothetical protein QOF20_428 [Acidimicrobiaceae bacterium]|nr:hypothetical protein [Acidimicrobiaceae bacterium]